jgi:hypothetical protein
LIDVAIGGDLLPVGTEVGERIPVWDWKLHHDAHEFFRIITPCSFYELVIGRGRDQWFLKRRRDEILED